MVKQAVAGVLVLVLLGGCGGGSPTGAPTVEPQATARKRIPGIDGMGLEDLSNWVAVCAPYNGSPEGRARNPYDPMDCDEVQYRHDAWRQPRSQAKAAQDLPGLH